MEAWHRLSAMGGTGSFRVWRTTLHFLSAGFLDSRRAHQRNSPLDDRLSRLYLARTGGGGCIEVCSGAALARPARCHLGRRAVRGEPVSPGDRLLAERVCRVAGGQSGPLARAVRFEIWGRQAADDGPARTPAGRILAGE